MNRLTVQVRGPGGRTRQELFALRDGLVLGDGDGQGAVLLGARLVVRRDPDGWTVGGHALRQGHPLEFRVGDVVVRVEGELVSVDDRAGPDPRIWVAALAILSLLTAAGVVKRLIAAAAEAPPALEHR